MLENSNDTIFALGSAYGKAGVAIFRISGAQAFEIGKTICGLSNDFKIKPNYLFRAKLYEIQNGQVDTSKILDDAMVVFFKNPQSFTGEDVVELHTHGGRAIINSILENLAKFNSRVRLAERGEFTKRAFKNGKMDLIEVEGLADLIEANTETQRQQAIKQMGGKLSVKYNEWRAKILKVLSNVEATIDFSEDDIPQNLEQQIDNEIADLKTELIRFLDDNKSGQIIRDGFSVAILGSPNVGKSTLFNRLVGEDKSIISSTAGTTRDIVEVNIDLNGYAVSVSDTAGIRESLDEIENEGMRRALEKAENADLVIYVSDNLKDLQSYSSKSNEDKMLVLNKIDLQNSVTDYDKNIHLICAKDGQGFSEFLLSLQENIKQRIGKNEDVVITRTRHRTAIESAVANLQNSISAPSVDIKAENIKLAANDLGRVVGVIDVEEIYGSIFSSFCIGK